MKRTVFFTITFACVFSAVSQTTFFYDRKNFAIVQANHFARLVSEAQFTEITRKSQDMLNDANINIAKFVIAKNRVYNALLNVNSAFKNSKQVIQIGNQVGGILTNIDLLKNDIASEPQFSFLTREFIHNIVHHSVALSEMVTNIAFQGEEKNVLMNYQQRDQLLKDISTRLHIINANINLMRTRIYYAKMDGFWKTINPFREWINQDRRIIENIIRRSKYL